MWNGYRRSIKKTCASGASSSGNFVRAALGLAALKGKSVKYTYTDINKRLQRGAHGEADTPGSLRLPQPVPALTALPAIPAGPGGRGSRAAPRGEVPGTKPCE